MGSIFQPVYLNTLEKWVIFAKNWKNQGILDNFIPEMKNILETFAIQKKDETKNLVWLVKVEKD